MDGNRYSNTSNQHSQRGNGIGPPPKRPKLSIDKQSRPSSNNGSTSTHVNVSSTNYTKPKEENFSDGLWGDDLDEQVLKVIELDESLALSQMLNTQTTANIVGYPASNKCHVPLKGFESRQSKVPVGVNANITGHTLKGAPLRKTASSGCPTSRDRSNNQSNHFSEFQSKTQIGSNNLKQVHDRNAGNTPNWPERPGTEQRPDVGASKVADRLTTHGPNNSLKGVPLRRTSSSGWPSANTFSPSPSSLITPNTTEKPIEVHKLQVELDRMSIDNNNLKEKLNRKTGEVSLLRDKLINVQQEKSRELNKQRKEFTDKMNTIRQEAESTINHLTKENQSLKSKLDVDVMEKEISASRVNQESPFRSKNNLRLTVRQSLAEGSLLHGQPLVEARALTSQYRLLYKLICLELMQPTQPEAPISETVRAITDDKLFSDEMTLNLPKISLTLTEKIRSTNSSLREVQPSTSAGVPQPLPPSSSEIFTTARDRLSATARVVSESCTTVEPCQISSLATLLSTLSNENEQQVISEVVEKCSHVVRVLLCQLEATACPRNKCTIEREQEVVHRGYRNLILTDNRNLLLSGRELYNNERGISTRRALALLSILVEFSEFAASQILSSSESAGVKRPKGGQQVPSASSSQAVSLRLMLLGTIKDMVHQIKNQRRTLMFEGVLASTAKLVASLLQSKLTLTSQSQDQLVQILRVVVFAGPGSLVLHYVLQALLAATKYPDITDNLCHNADTCLLQVLCEAVQLVETPRKHLLSDTYTAWILTLFYSVARDPCWLFTVPSKTSCQCRPLVSRLAFQLIGEACLTYPTVSDSDEDKKRLEELLTRAVLVVSTLLYHDEHFGVNVNSISVGYYELFITSMNHLDIQLPRAHHDIMETIIKQEEDRTRSICPEQNNELTSLLLPFYKNPKRSGDVLELLDSL